MSQPLLVGVFDEPLRIFTHFHINYGKKTTFGHDCFVNFGCTFLALGGITISENAIVAQYAYCLGNDIDG
jgi:acetyltransferase-like isoleucine patch superfamily enzyme